MQPHKHLNQIFLSCLISSHVTLETMDMLAETNSYRHALKMAGNRFVKELESIMTAQLSKSLDVDNDALFSCIEYQKDFVKSVADMRPEDYGVITSIVELYREDPERIMQALELSFAEGKL